MKAETRFLYDLKSVLYDQKWLKKAKNFPVYYIKRGVQKKNGLRYDITVIEAKMLGKEFVKTKGHEHKYQELYTVLQGEAIFLVQKTQGLNIKEIYAVRAKKSESVIIPPSLGHLTINSSKQNLKIGNWIDERCKNDYKLFTKMQGAGYYYAESGWIKNGNYKRVPKLRFKKPLKSIPKNLDFLKK